MRQILRVFLLMSVFGAASVMAQNSCEDPFDGQTLRFDTRFWQQTDFCLRSIDLQEVRSGGPPPDGIPPLDAPVFQTLADAQSWLQPQSPVIAVAIDGQAKAYPLAILIWHEIVNDVLADRLISVTYCPLCNSALVFDRVVEGVALTFGVSGNLRNSDMIMWDRQTQSWWQQFTGEGIVGVYTGTVLELIPSQIVGFGDFSAQYPDGLVLSRETGFTRSYGQNPYVGYDQTSQPFLFEGEIDTRLPATEHVLAGVIGGEPVAYPFAELREQGVINDVAGDVPVAAFWQGGVTSALDALRIDEARDIGTAALYARTLSDGRVLTFERDAEGIIRDVETASAWNLFGEAYDGDLTGEQLRLTFAAPHFWFAWAAFRPDTRIWSDA